MHARMPTAVREPTASRGVDESMAHNTAGCGESLSGVAAAANGLDAKSPAAASAARSSILQIQRQYPAAFAAVAAAAAATGQLQLLQDPLWLAAMGAVHAWKHNTNSEVPCNAEARYASAAAEEGEAVAAAIREAAKEAGGGDPVVRLLVAATLREAAALLHSIGDALAASSQKIYGGKHESTIRGSQHSEGTQCLAAAAEQAANALELWHLRLMTLPISVSLVSLGSRGAAPWKPRPCVTFSGVAATPLLEQTAASNELLQLHQQVRLALRVLASLDVCSLENIQPLHIRCMHALQQAQQLALQLAPPAVATKAGETAAAEALTETAAEAATETTAADTAAAGSFAYTCDSAATPPPISASPESYDRELNWQHFLRSRGTLAAPGSGNVWSMAGKVQHRQQEMLHWWPNPLAAPLGHLLWNLRFLGKRQTTQEVLLPRGFFLPTASPHWRGDFVGCTANAATGSAVESSFLLKHAAKLHALLTSSLRPELALR